MRFDEICLQTGTDKSSKRHNFCSYYEDNIDFTKVQSLLEVGVLKGGSKQAWERYLPHAKVHAFDLNPEQCQKSCDNVSFTNQNSKSELSKSIGEKTYDVILDDGGHSMKQQTNISRSIACQSRRRFHHGGSAHFEPWNKYSRTSDAEPTTVEIFSRTHQV